MTHTITKSPARKAGLFENNDNVPSDLTVSIIHQIGQSAEAARPADRGVGYRAKLSVFTSESPKVLSKRYCLKDGELCKSTSANMTQGTATPHNIETLSDLSKLLQSLRANQAICFGIAGDAPKKIVTKEKWLELGKPADPIARSIDAFRWPDGGVMLLDYDPQGEEQSLGRDELVSAIREAVPGMADAAMLWWPSSSSHVCNGDQDMTGLRGQRLYPLVKDASDIPRAGAALVDHLWASGYGYILLSSSGQMLERCLVDANVWQTNRLDFAAGAVCQEPLEQRRGKPIIIPGVVEAVDTRLAIPDPDAATKVAADAARAKAKALVKEEADQIQAEWVIDRAANIVSRMGETSDEALKRAENTARRARESGVMTGDFIVTVVEAGQRIDVTVGEILDDPSRFHNLQTLDPLEPEYLGNKIVGRLYLIGSRPNLHSFAHGGQNFKLMRQPQFIEVVQGQMHNCVMQTLGILRAMPDVFDMGGQLVTIDNGGSCALSEPTLSHYLGGVLQFFHVTTSRDGVGRQVFDDPPNRLTQTIISLGANRNLKPLNAVITAPIMTPDGHVMTRPGYHASSRLLLDTAESLPSIPDNVTNAHVRAAVGTLMEPFKDFPFCSDLDKAVFLASLMSAVQRAVLPTCPGFAFDAPVQGSGKTLLAQCVAALGTGEQPTVWPHTAGRDDEEVRKRIFTALRGGERALIWDNVTGVFNSAAVAALLTGASFTDRQLGKSESITIPNRALFLMTGNNMSFAGDMPRRVMKCRIDPQTDRPYARSFALDPLKYTINNRQVMVAAVLTIIRGWFQSVDYIAGQSAMGRMASFEQWDDMIRQPIAWLHREVMPGKFADVMDAVDTAQGNDPEQEALSDLLRELHAAFEGQYFTARDVMQKINTCFVGVNGLAEAVNDLANGEVRSSKSLGKVLTFRTGRIVDGLVLTEVVKNRHANVRRWVVQTAAQK